MTHKVTKPIALDESLNTTEETPRNIADVLAEGLAGIGEAVSTEAELPLKKVNGKLTNNGNRLTVTGDNAWAEGDRTEATGDRAHAEGSNTNAGAAESHAEGANTIASGQGAHAEGGSTHATGQYSHSEGYNTQATRLTSHAEGRDTEASHVCSHAEGYKSKASGESSHSEGENTEASGQGSHAEGGACVASADYSHASGEGTRATGRGSTAVGMFNSDGTALFVVGNGVSPDEGDRADAFKVDRLGRSYVKNEAGNLVKIRGAGTAIFTASRSGGTYTYPNADDVIDAISNYDEVIIQLVSSIEGTFNYVYDYSLITNEYRWIREDGSHVITLTGAGSPLVWTWSESSRSIGGSDIYGSLQDAIADAASLNIGDYFETNGFHTSGDGGAARYIVSDTGTANGMDIVQLAGGKLAVLQVTSEGLYPEQLGYVPTKVYDDRVDCTSTFNRIWALCDTVRLHKARYWFNGYLTLPTSAKIIGEAVYGTDVSEMTTYRNGDYFIYCENRENVIENVVLSNRHNGGNLSPVSTGGVGIRSTEWSGGGAAHFDYAFRHLRLMGFRKGLELQGGVKWAVTLYDIRCSQCYIGIEFGEASFNIDLHKIYTDHCEYAGINFHGEGVFGFYDCNLGSINTAVKISEYVGGQYTDVLLTFINTNFECDDQSLTNIPGLYFDIDDALDVILNMYGCRFMQNAGVYTVSNRCMKLGAKTLVNMKGCEVRNNTGVAQPDDNFWNENYPCKFALGAIRISDNCRGVPTPQFTYSKFDLCCVETDLTEMEIISQGGGGTPVNNLWDNSSPTILAGYVSEANSDYPNGFFTLNYSIQMTLAIPITNYMQGQTIRISAGTTSHNRWKYGKIGAIPTAAKTDLTYVDTTKTDSSGRTYSDIPVGATETGYILIFFGSGISSTDIIADAMACVSPYYTPYESYQGGTTTYSRKLRTGLINLDELVTALNLRGNSLV